jgi:hypothetical protein
MPVMKLLSSEARKTAVWRGFLFSVCLFTGGSEGIGRATEIGFNITGVQGDVANLADLERPAGDFADACDRLWAIPNMRDSLDDRP